ncbi:metallophosphoesterase family protein [Methanogenium organophilum]|uniref:Metallophosphoesterase family protein n=1 Tax=Methanogenium organophilum TaxID=2199 RepID=A0A9X9S487_METOG|nr:metallophosphoesterase family protein [Methanogenium organophilum]WAI01381.1 metallophosphoesterase family protein [Methanogenium organophilum]
MQTNTPEYAIANPLFAGWKLNDAIREFGETMHITGTIPITGIPLPDSFTHTITHAVTSPGDETRYLPVTITGWNRIRRGCRFSFELRATLEERPPISSRTTGSGPAASVCLPITPPGGYLATLLKMHRHNIPLTGMDAHIAGAFAKVTHRGKTQKHHRCRPLLLATDATRIILPENDIYDLPLGRSLTETEAASETVLRESHTAYRRARGYECTGPFCTAAPETFLTADLHLGHRDAIRYYCRPFLPEDSTTMDRVLISNWNHTVGPEDHVIFAGDFTYKADGEQTDAYRSMLNGTITWIEGNHDTCLRDTVASHTLTADGHSFLVVHNPKHVPATYRGWVIHGHTHNARLSDYPFISFTNRTVNISTDVTGYRPVPLTEILTLIREGERTGRTRPILTRAVSPPGTDTLL